jgi:hypothetical protein
VTDPSVRVLARDAFVGGLGEILGVRVSDAVTIGDLAPDSLALTELAAYFHEVAGVDPPARLASMSIGELYDAYVAAVLSVHRPR